MKGLPTFHRAKALWVKNMLALSLYLFTSVTFAQQQHHLLSLPVSPVSSGQIADDTVSLLLRKERKAFFDHRAVRIGLAPTLFFTASALTWGERESIRRKRNRYIPGFKNGFDDYMQYAPAAAVYSMKLAKVRGRNSMSRTLFSHGASLVIMGALVNSIKYTAKVERPDGSTRNSFPSGHTAMAFTNATFMHKEYGLVNPLYSIAGYSGATFTALGRSLNNRHWMPDILAGAGIGILSTQLGYFFIDKLYGNEGDHIGLLSRVRSNGHPSYLSVKLGNATAMRNLMELLGNGARTKPGFESGFEGAWFIGKHWGIGGEFAFMSFPVSPSDNFLLDEEYPDLGNVKLRTESIGTLNIGIGPHYALDLGNRWLLMAKAETGLAFGAKGKIMYELEKNYPGIEQEAEMLSYKPHTAWRGCAGASITYKFHDEMGISFYTNYNYSRPTINFSLSESLRDAEDESLQVEAEQAFDYLGIGLRLTAFF
ncbi:phosphatase PAP2 family protein [Tannerella sp.]|uniref:phosphatase PAP2 family protein n=1 Tax=Tannerella sp. TaxID=2382127 RepID=UPI0026DBDE54|nr:phosphatase PAP2 family protein [Tannerella sp.]MDO4703772.1 phosphatase PAP2 family protein [Tannerella sp.]